ncbi:S-adenosylmethionine decarboxylase [Leptolyngbya sp. 'hensonii']|uniref:S-adenosylmethionine decarboxylase family protein n=1 Tax=Leptolyngbya sp. 'hensonii' TaxID=1922337 RepID=UPI00209AB4ED|nr:S-adenosylmethionine decarboxylase [Leptolyngbya sp. 'hensonii']
MTVSPRFVSWQEVDFLALLKEAVSAAQLTAVGEVAHTFQPQGISVALLLAESHVALHFWPDLQKVAIDIHVCDYQQENQHKAEHLAELLTAKLTDPNLRAVKATDPAPVWHYLSASG